MKPAAFEYLKPTTLENVLSLLAQHGSSAKLIAGGQSLVPMMNFRLATPEILIDINGLSSLDYVRREGDSLRIGAQATHAVLADSTLVRQLCPLMSEAYKYVAHATVRNRGTLCGNLAHADPASEMPAVMLAVNATLVIRNATAERLIPAKEFFQGLYATAITPVEMLVEVRIPATPRLTGYAFEEVSSRQGDFAMGLVAALVEVRGDLINSAAVSFAGFSDRAYRLEAVDDLLKGKKPSDSLFLDAAEAAIALIEISQDAHADREYRCDLIRTLTRRTLAKAVTRATSNA